MRIGMKLGQINLPPDARIHLWREAEEAGFESIWVLDHLTGYALCYEAIGLLAALAVSTSRVRIGCLVLIQGLRPPELLAAQLETVDALSAGRLEIGLGAGDQFADQDFKALGLSFPRWPARLKAFRTWVERLRSLLSPASPLSARPRQQPVPLILGGRVGTHPGACDPAWTRVEPFNRLG